MWYYLYSSVQQETGKIEKRGKSKKSDNHEKGNNTLQVKEKVREVAQTGKQIPQPSQHGKSNKSKKSNAGVSQKLGVVNNHLDSQYNILIHGLGHRK